MKGFAALAGLVASGFVVWGICIFVVGLTHAVNDAVWPHTTDYLYGADSQTAGWVTLFAALLIAFLWVAQGLRGWLGVAVGLAGAAGFTALLFAGHPVSAVIAVFFAIGASRSIGRVRAGDAGPCPNRVAHAVAGVRSLVHDPVILVTGALLLVLALLPLTSSWVGCRVLSAVAIVGLMTLASVLRARRGADEATQREWADVLADLLRPSRVEASDVRVGRGPRVEFPLSHQQAARLTEVEQARIDGRALLLHPTVKPDWTALDDDVFRLVPSTSERAGTRSALLAMTRRAPSVPSTETATLKAVAR